ncbi:MAG: MurR/RpiR family transcriptional regulator [Alphaproteobacteria bacterium]
MLESVNLIEEIKRSLDKLRRSDRKVAEKILENPQSVPQMKLAKLAKLSDVSEPTVIRFCNSIGCEGFQDMKIKLARSLAFGLSTSHAAISDKDDFNEVINKIFDFNLTSLDWVRTKLDRKALADAVDCILEAKSLYFFGLGASSIVAQDAQQKFPLFGIPCQSISDTHQMLINVSMMQKGDVVIAISDSGKTQEIIRAADVARSHGAKVIGLTGSKSPLTEHSDISLIVESLDNTDKYTPTISRMAALVIIDILSTYTVLRRPIEQRERLDAMKQYIADVRSYGLNDDEKID